MNIDSISEYKIFERNKTYNELEVLIDNCKKYNETLTLVVDKFIDECNSLREIKLSIGVMAQILMENYKHGNNTLLWSEWFDLINFISQHKKMKEYIEQQSKKPCEHKSFRPGHSPFVPCICNDCNQEL